MEDKRKHNIHITPGDGGGWDIQPAGGGKHSHHRTKEEAGRAGRAEAKKAHAELKIHNKDGKISESVSYGNDPFPPKG